jgi:hypothetical protein
LEDLASAVIRTTASNLVVCCRQPVPRLQAEIMRAQRPFLVALGDPRAAVRNLTAHPGYSVLDAVRAVASSCAAMAAIATARHALILNPADARNPRSAAAAIAHQYQLAFDHDEVLQIVEQLPAPGLEIEDADHRAWEEQLSERDRAIVNGALASYLAAFAGASLGDLVWQPELFYMYEDPPAPNLEPVIRPVELTGRVRFLLFGPFINVPAGAWTVTIVLAFSPEAVGMGFSIEVFAGRSLATTRIDVVGAQVHEARLPFTIDDTLDQPVQIRIMNERAAFDGRLALGHVVLRPEPSVGQKERERLEHSLGQHR